MPLDQSPFTTTELHMRRKEAFLTEGLNARNAGIVPPGIYRGFRLGTSGTALHVSVNPDPVMLDNVASITTTAGFVLAVRRLAPLYDLDLSNVLFLSTTVVITLQGFYSATPPTTATHRIFTLLEFDGLTASQRQELVVIGTVVVPAAGVIPAANITHDRRTSAWATTSPEATPWVPLLKNPSFEIGTASELVVDKWGARFWEVTGGFVHSKFSPYVTGIRKALCDLTTIPKTASVFQRLYVPVYEGQLVRFRYSAHTTGVNSGGSVEAFVEWGTGAGTVAFSQTFPITCQVDVGYRLFEHTFVVPATIRSILRIGIRTIGITAFPSQVLSVDGVQCWLEAFGPLDLNGLPEGVIHPVSAYPLLLDDALAVSPISALGAAVLMDSTSPAGEGQIKVQRKDSGAGLAPLLRLLGRLMVGEASLDTEANALLARYSAGYAALAGIDYTLMEENLPVGGGVFAAPTRLYRDTNGSFVVTTNAKWRAVATDNWTRDNALLASSFFRFTGGSMEAQSKAAASASPWTAWDETSSYAAAGASVSGAVSINDSLTNGWPGWRILSYPSPTQAHTKHWTTSDEDGVGDRQIRIYTTSSGSNSIRWAIVHNAYWDQGATAWKPDADTSPAWRLMIEDQHIEFARKAAVTPASWADAVGVGGWDQEEFFSFHGRIQLGAGLLSTAADALLPRVRALSAASGRTLIYDSDAGGTQQYTRAYINGFGNTEILEFTINAKSDGSGTPWTKDRPTSPAIKLEIGSAGLILSTRAAASGSPWIDNGVGGWDNEQLLRVDGRLQLQTLLTPLPLINTFTLSPENPAPALPQTFVANTLYGLGIPKAWGRVIVTAAVVVTSPDGMNISALTASTVNNTVSVFFTSIMDNDDYSIVATADSPDPLIRFVMIEARSALGFTVRLADLTMAGPTVSIVDIGLEGCSFNFAVYGRQP